MLTRLGSVARHTGHDGRSTNTRGPGASRSTRRTSTARRWGIPGLLATAMAVCTLLVTAAAPAGAATTYPIGGLGTAVSNFIFSPGNVAGANNWSCRPTAAHPYPVVLVPATFADVGDNWVALSPMLADAGYCVYSFNYGMTWFSFGRVGGLGDIAASAQTMASFVNKVLAATGAHQVDVVGHSQGGMMPNYYIKFLGGASKVHTFVGLAPSNHGTTLSGLVTFGQDLNLLGFVNDVFVDTGMPGLYEQEVGSPFQQHLFAGGDTVPGPHYVVIETDHDEVVTPYTNAFLSGPNVENILLQSQCPSDPVGHIGLFLDGPALADVMNALAGGSPSYVPPCTNYGLPL